MMEERTEEEDITNDKLATEVSDIIELYCSHRKSINTGARRASFSSSVIDLTSTSASSSHNNHDINNDATGIEQLGRSVTPLPGSVADGH